MALKKKNKNNSKYLVIFMAFIMVSSVFGVIFYGFNQDDENTVEYKGIKFKLKENIWYAKINNKEIAFNFIPEELNSITVPDEARNILKNSIQLDVTSDYNSSLKEYIALSEYFLSESLSTANIYLRSGFTTTTDTSLPKIICEAESETDVPIIYFLESEKTEISIKDNCITAKALDGIDILKIKDKIAYIILGIE